MSEIRLSAAEAGSASAIQQAIDGLGDAGGRVVLPEGETILDRGLELRSNLELVGQGRGTVLRKARGRVYPLSGYHNYGMLDVPLEFTDGLEPGMTVAIRDDVHGGFFETFARITWVDGTWVGLDRGLHSDYAADKRPVLVTSYPLVFGRGVRNVAIRSLTLDGNRDEQPAGIGACRGAAVYLIRSHGFEVTDVEETGFAGEGLGFQMCSRGHITRCRFDRNAGNGYHPGAGSTAALFEDCIAEGNDRAGFYFCVRANHVTVRDCAFVGNVSCGVSVGTRDCHNRIEGCRVADNQGPGILFRPASRPAEVHSCVVARCQVEDNARATGRGQIDVLGDAHDLAFVDNRIRGLPDRAGIYVAPSAERVWLADNEVENCWPAFIVDHTCLAPEAPSIECGVETVRGIHFRHLLQEPGEGREGS